MYWDLIGILFAGLIFSIIYLIWILRAKRAKNYLVWAVDGGWISVGLASIVICACIFWLLVGFGVILTSPVETSSS